MVDKLFKRVLLYLLVMSPGAGFAVEKPDQWGLCPDILTGPEQLQPAQPPVESTDSKIIIEADSSQASADGYYRFEGDVRLQRDGLSLQAASVEYNREGEQLTLYDNIALQQRNFHAWGDEAQFSLQQQTGEIRHSRFAVADRHARGEAETISFLGPRRYALTDGSYTTCLPGKETWVLRAKRVTLDYDSNTGTASHVVLRFLGKPVFYFPYLSFPVAGRKSGLLIPEFGSTSTLGNNLLQPVYWNIAPNQDATLSFHPTSKRGMHYLGEYRYLHALGGGRLNLEYVPEDKETGETRHYYGLQAGARPLSDLTMGVDVQDVSDRDYFGDFGDRYSSALVAHVPRQFNLTWNPSALRLGTRFLSYKTIDEDIAPENRPYDLLPAVNLRVRPVSLAGLSWRLHTDVSRFASGVRVEGWRSHLYQSLDAPLQGAAWYVQPRVFHHFLSYSLSNTAATADTEPTLSVPGFSVDSGLFLERDFSFDERAFVQTLEPRLYYLYVPYRDQTGMITDSSGTDRVFDTAAQAMSWEGLFRENRFAGLDRVGDADQLAVSLSSRVLDGDSGRERLLAGIGQIHYFSDRRVTLPGAAEETRPRSDIFAVLRVKPRDWIRVNSGVQWSESLDQAVSTWFLLGYNPILYNTVNLGYRLDRDPLSGDATRLEQDISFYWKVTPRINLIGRRNRDVLGQVNREMLFGFEYDDCCWALRAVTRRYLPADILAADARDRDYRNVLMLQLVLKGLTSVGSSVDTLLKNTHYGVTGN